MSKNLSEQTISRLLQTLDAIEDRKARYFDMYIDVEGDVANTDELPTLGNNFCGTACCFGGMAGMLSGRAKNNADLYVRSLTLAREWLGITEDQGDRLFFTDLGSNCWPVDLAERYAAVDGKPKKRRAILRERIERFIATDGEE